MSAIYHVATPADWAEAQQTGEYRTSTRGKTLDEVGFIHASTEGQVAPVANAIFHGDNSLVVLVIDPDRLRSEVRYEQVPGWDAPFPHIYGPLNADAVVETLPLVRSAEGQFSFTPDHRQE
jgi:uncharacterized protein (DUF952 family)